MLANDNPKWNDKLEVTYLDLVKYQYQGLISLVKQLETTLGEEKTRALLGEIYLSYLKEWAKNFVKTNPINNMEDFIKVKRSFGSPRSHQLEVVEAKSTSYKENYSSCIYAKVFRDLGVPELGYIMFCATDFPLAQLLNPKLKLERSKTLMQGDECCDFHYIWENKE